MIAATGFLELDNVRNFGIFAVIMGYAKERVKLEKLSEKIVGLEIYNEKNLVLLIDGYEKYSHTIRILKNKEPETFEDLYKNDLQVVKEAKKAVKEVVLEYYICVQNKSTCYLLYS